MNLPRGPLNKSLFTTLYYWVQSTTNSVIYTLNILSNQKSAQWELLLLIEFNYLTNSRVQFLGAAFDYLPLFSINISNHSIKIIENLPNKISCNSMYTYLCIHCSFLIRGFLFSFWENSHSFPSGHYEISFLFNLQKIPSFTNSRSQQCDHLLERGYKTLGSSYLNQKNPLDTNPFGLTSIQVNSYLRHLLGMQQPSFYISEGMGGNHLIHSYLSGLFTLSCIYSSIITYLVQLCSTIILRMQHTPIIVTFINIVQWSCKKQI